MPLTLRRGQYLVISHGAEVLVAELADCLPLSTKSYDLLTLTENESCFVVCVLLFCYCVIISFHMKPCIDNRKMYVYTELCANAFNYIASILILYSTSLLLYNMFFPQLLPLEIFRIFVWFFLSVFDCTDVS